MGKLASHRNVMDCELGKRKDQKETWNKEGNGDNIGLLSILKLYWNASRPFGGHVFDKEDNGKKLAASYVYNITILLWWAVNVNFLEEHLLSTHGFVVWSIEEPGDQSRCLVPGPSKTKEPGSPSQRQLLCCEWQESICSQGQRKGIEREWEKQRWEQAGGKNLEHTGQTLGRKKLGMRKEIFLVSGDWVGVKEYGFTFQGLNKVPQMK